MNTKEWLARLIQFNTISSASNKELIEAIHLWFISHQIESHIIPGTREDKFNLFATIPAHNGEINGGLILSGHTDVVPVAGQPWDSDPFVVKEHEGKIYGRGACDMKGFIAAVLALVPEFKKLPLSKPIHFAFTCDEEVGCIGVNYLIDFLKEQGIQPEGCIVGEPSSMKPIIGEKSRRLYHGQVKGKSSHASLPFEGCNAIEYASRLICYINDLARHIEKNGPFEYEFECPYTTITTNIISGGIASNVVPDTCEFIVDIRYINSFLFKNFISQIELFIQAELIPQMQKTYPEAMIYFDQTSDAPGFHAIEDSRITQIVRAVTGIKERFKVSYATEAGIYQNAHIPTIICGPGDIEQAHKPNEFISIDQLELCENVLHNVVTFFCSDLK